MIPSRFLALVLLLIIAGRSQCQQRIRIWPGPAPGTENQKGEKKVVDNRIYGVYQPELLAYFPTEADANHAAVLVCPGGGYTHLTIGLEGKDVAKWLNKNGIAAFVLEYRLDPRDAFEDAKQAMSFLRANAAKYHLNPDMIGIAGFSAGGQVAAWLATHHGTAVMTNYIDSVSSRPDFLILAYPALNWLHPNADKEIDDSSKTKDGFIHYFRLVNKDSPPTFIVHAADDKTVPVTQSIELFTALHEAKVPVELHIFAKGGHGFGLGSGRGEAASWPKLCVRWLKTEGILSK